MAAVADYFVQELPLGAVPGRDALAQVAVQPAEVGLNLTEVGEQRPRRLGELLVAVPLRGGVEHREIAAFDCRNLQVDVVASALQLRQPRAGVGFRAEHQLAQQLEDGVQPRLGADKGPVAQGPDPRHGPLDRRGGVVVRFVGALRVELAQPTRFGRGPIVEVGLR